MPIKLEPKASSQRRVVGPAFSKTEGGSVLKGNAAFLVLPEFLVQC